jgi:hypothetical protein
MGSVYLAEDRKLDRQVAVKVLRAPDDPGLLERFRREAEVMARIEHPNLVRLLDYEVDGPFPLLVMEFVPGRDLAKPPRPEPVPTMLEVGEALTAMHQARLLHRDVKPANILIGDEGRVVLADLGLAKAEDLEALTRTGVVVGTPAFLAPEVLLGTPMSQASDWYAWGATLYVLVEDRPCVRPEDVHALVTGTPFPEPEFLELEEDSRTAEVIRRCLASEPADRPQGLADIRRILDQHTPGAVSPEDPTVSVSTTRLVSGKPGPPGADTPPRPVRPGLPLALATLGFLGLGWVATLSWSSAPPRTEAPAPPPSAGALPLEDLLRKELEQHRPLLSDDPARYRHGLEALPHLWRLLRAHVEDHRLDGLPPETREALVDLDGAYQAELGEPVLAPFLAGSAAKFAPPVVPSKYILVFADGEKAPNLRGRWTGAAVSAFEEAWQRLGHWTKEFQRDPASITTDQRVLTVGGIVGDLDYGSYVQAASVHQESRTRARDRTLIGIAAYRRALALAGRALEAREPDEELAGAVFFEYLNDLAPFTYSGGSTLPVEVQLAEEPTRPASWALHGEVLRRSWLSRNDFGPRVEMPAERLYAAWALALAPNSEAPPRWVAWRRGRALQRIHEYAQDAGRVAEAAGHFRRALPWLETLEQPPGRWMVRMLVEVAEDPTMVLALGEGEAGRLLAAARRMVPLLPPEVDPR